MGYRYLCLHEHRLEFSWYVQGPPHLDIMLHFAKNGNGRLGIVGEFAFEIVDIKHSVGHCDVDVNRCHIRLPCIVVPVSHYENMGRAFADSRDNTFIRHLCYASVV